MPSVMESPKVTMVRAGLLVATSTAEIMARTGRGAASVSAAAPASSPGVTYPVSTAVPWQVQASTWPGRYRLIASFDSAGTAMSTGSLSRGEPGRITPVGLPPKVRTWSLPAWIAPPSPAIARCAAPTATGAVPNSLVKRTRTCVPPPLMRTTCRMVWSWKVGEPAIGPMAAVGAWGEAPQLRAQCRSAAWAAETDSSQTAARAGNAIRFTMSLR